MSTEFSESSKSGYNSFAVFAIIICICVFLAMLFFQTVEESDLKFLPEFLMLCRVKSYLFFSVFQWNMLWSILYLGQEKPKSKAFKLLNQKEDSGKQKW